LDGHQREVPTFPWAHSLDQVPDAVVQEKVADQGAQWASGEGIDRDPEENLDREEETILVVVEHHTACWGIQVQGGKADRQSVHREDRILAEIAAVEDSPAEPGEEPVVVVVEGEEEGLGYWVLGGTCSVWTAC
jgi:hypothetical protein